MMRDHPRAETAIPRRPQNPGLSSVILSETMGFGTNPIAQSKDPYLLRKGLAGTLLFPSYLM